MAEHWDEKSPHPGPSASVHSGLIATSELRCMGSVHPATLLEPALDPMTQVSANRVNINPGFHYQASEQLGLLLNPYPCLPGRSHQPPAWVLHGHQHVASSHGVSEEGLGDINKGKGKRATTRVLKCVQQESCFKCPLCGRLAV